MRTCGMRFIKYILFGFNVIFAISGLGILVAGALVLANINEFNHFLENNVTAPPIVLIVTGTVIFFIASLGCLGAIKESPRLLILYAVLLAIIFVIEFAVGIAAAVFKSDLEMALKNTLRSTIERSSVDDLQAWDNIQMKLMCCGVDSPKDWGDLSKHRILRPSCCVKQAIDIATNDCRDSNFVGKDKYYQDGCIGKLKEKIDKNAVILIGVGIGIAFIQILGIVLACYLAKRIRHEREK
ncbi:TSPAN6 family protein [Megaselia abdita]